MQEPTIAVFDSARGQRAEQRGSSPELEELRALPRRPTGLRRTALVLGVAGALGVLALAAVAAWVACSRTYAGIMDSQLQVASLLATSDSAEELERGWTSISSLRDPRYICVIGRDGTLARHSLRPQAVGLSVADVELDAGRTVGDLVAERGSWVGRNVNLSGKEQIAAYVWSDALDGLVVVHTPFDEVERKLLAASVPWMLALGVVALFLLPTSLLLFQRWVEDASRRLRELEEERQQLHAQMRAGRSLEALGRLAGGIAHDFNNLLTVVRGHTELLEVRLAPDDERRSSLAQIREASERATELVHQLGTFGQERKDGDDVADLGRTVLDLERLLRRLLPEDIELDLGAVEPGAYARCDAPRLGQVLINLAVNCRDAMPTGGRISVRTSVEPADEGRDDVLLEVTDSGGGMPQSVLDRGFEPFFTTKGELGSGLGLATVLGIVQGAGGILRVQSQTGVGTTVRVYLPRTIESAGDSPGDSPGVRPTATLAPARPPAADTGHEQVLVVEDRESIRDLLANAFRARGYRVLTAQDGAEALRLLESHAGTVDAVVTDAIMPNLSGVELARAARARDPRLRVLLITGRLEASSLEDAAIDAVLEKPFVPEEVLRLVREMLDTRTPTA